MKINKLEKILIDCYRKVYSESTPPADFDKMMESGETRVDGFFMNYTLSDERQNEIIAEAIKANKLKDWDAKWLTRNYLLGCSPKSA